MHRHERQRETHYPWIHLNLTLWHVLFIFKEKASKKERNWEWIWSKRANRVKIKCSLKEKSDRILLEWVIYSRSIRVSSCYTNNVSLTSVYSIRIEKKITVCHPEANHYKIFGVHLPKLYCVCVSDCVFLPPTVKKYYFITSYFHSTV